MDAWMASRENLSEEIQCLVESSLHLAAIMDELADEKNASEDTTFSLFSRSIFFKATYASKENAANPITTSPEDNFVPLIEESIKEEAT